MGVIPHTCLHRDKGPIRYICVLISRLPMFSPFLSTSQLLYCHIEIVKSELTVKNGAVQQTGGKTAS